MILKLVFAIIAFAFFYKTLMSLSLMRKRLALGVGFIPKPKGSKVLRSDPFYAQLASKKRSTFKV